MADRETCGDCGEPIYSEEGRRWVNQHGLAWCYGPGGTRTGWNQQHAPAGYMPIRVKAAEGKACFCVSSANPHIHLRADLPDYICPECGRTPHPDYECEVSCACCTHALPRRKIKGEDQ